MPYYCPRCGKETVYSEELEGLCEDCFREKYKIPSLNKLDVDIKLCPICGRVKFGNKWVRGNIVNLKHVALSQLKKKKILRGYDVRIDLRNIGDNEPLLSQLLSDNYIVIPAEIYKRDIMIQTVTLEIKINKQVCPTCRKKATGNYYEYVIHVRFTGGKAREKEVKVRNIISRVLSYAKPDVFIDVRKIHRGMDIRVSDRRIGDKLLHRIIDAFNTDARQYSERRFESTLNRYIVVRKATVNI